MTNKIFYLIMIILLMSCHNQSPAKLWEDANLLRLENNMKDCIINLDDLITDGVSYTGAFMNLSAIGRWY